MAISPTMTPNVFDLTRPQQGAEASQKAAFRIGKTPGASSSGGIDNGFSDLLIEELGTKRVEQTRELQQIEKQQSVQKSQPEIRSGKEIPTGTERSENISSDKLMKSLGIRMAKDAGVENPEGLFDDPFLGIGDIEGLEQAFIAGMTGSFETSPTTDSLDLTAILGFDPKADQLVTRDVNELLMTQQAESEAGTLSALSRSDDKTMPRRVSTAALLEARATIQRESRSVSDDVRQTLVRQETAGNGSGRNARHVVAAWMKAAPNAVEVDRPMAQSAQMIKPTTTLRAKTPTSESVEWSTTENAIQSAAQGVTSQAPVAPTTVPVTQAVQQSPQAQSPLMEYVARETKRHVLQGKREFKIHLNPGELGSIELDVSVEDDVMTVNILAASPEAQRLIEENIDLLEAALNEQGMAIDTGLPWKRPAGLERSALLASPKSDDTTDTKTARHQWEMRLAAKSWTAPVRQQVFLR